MLEQNLGARPQCSVRGNQQETTEPTRATGHIASRVIQGRGQIIQPGPTKEGEDRHQLGDWKAAILLSKQWCPSDGVLAKEYCLGGCQSKPVHFCAIQINIHYLGRSRIVLLVICVLDRLRYRTPEQPSEMYLIDSSCIKTEGIMLSKSSRLHYYPIISLSSFSLL